ncbi:MAG: hypothetical protein EOM85_02550 [Candidatus Moranbacteria bacterium]|nr:hypothetical protein [Candidatus Moranbacteria bacterium]
MSWASRRQIKYFSGFMLVVAVIVFIFIYPFIFKDSTCTDGKKNGDERGIDCGGSCSIVCREDTVAPAIIWSRAFKVIGNNYNLVAYVENRNKTAASYEATYEFRVYDVNNKFIGRKEGKTYIPPNQPFAVIETRFNAGQAELKTVSFEFTSNIVWVKKSPVLTTLPIRISNITMDNNVDTPTLRATVNNDSVYDLPEFDVVTILYDEDHNAINASKTHKAGLGSNSNTPVVFTWPEALIGAPVTQDILVQINPFLVSF